MPGLCSNLSVGCVKSTMTSGFLKDKLAVAQKDLSEIEDKVERYKKAFSGKLPTQLDSNLAQLRTLEAQLAATTSSISRAQTDKLLLENQISVLKERLQALNSVPASPLETAAKKLTKPEKNQFGVWATGPGTWNSAQEVMFAAGATYRTKDGTKTGMCNPAGVDAFGHKQLGGFDGDDPHGSHDHAARVVRSLVSPEWLTRLPQAWHAPAQLARGLLQEPPI